MAEGMKWIRKNRREWKLDDGDRTVAIVEQFTLWYGMKRKPGRPLMTAWSVYVFSHDQWVARHMCVVKTREKAMRVAFTAARLEGWR